jgi:hypothetical protein
VKTYTIYTFDNCNRRQDLTQVVAETAAAAKSAARVELASTHNFGEPYTGKLYAEKQA